MSANAHELRELSVPFVIRNPAKPSGIFVSHKPANGSTIKIVRMVQNSSSWTSGSARLGTARKSWALNGSKVVFCGFEPSNLWFQYPYDFLCHSIYDFRVKIHEAYYRITYKYRIGHPALSRMFHSSAHVRPVPPDSTVFPHWVPRPVAMIGPEGIS